MRDPIVQWRLGLKGCAVNNLDKGGRIKRNLKQFIHPQAFMIKMVQSQYQRKTEDERNKKSLLPVAGFLREEIEFCINNFNRENIILKSSLSGINQAPSGITPDNSFNSLTG